MLSLLISTIIDYSMVMHEPNAPIQPLDHVIREDLAAMRTYIERIEVFRNQTQLLILLRIPTENNGHEVPALEALTANMLDIIWYKNSGYWASIRSNDFPEAILVRNTLAAVHEYYENIVEHYPNCNSRMNE